LQLTEDGQSETRQKTQELILLVKDLFQVKGVVTIFDTLTEVQTKKLEKILNTSLNVSKTSEGVNISSQFDDPLLGDTLQTFFSQYNASDNWDKKFKLIKNLSPVLEPNQVRPFLHSL
jgi:hypothetical protein